MKTKIVETFRKNPIRQMSSMPNSASFVSIHQELLLWVDADIENTRVEVEDFNINKYLPPYQRDGNIWTTEMKEKFIKNTLKGYKTNIILATNPNRQNKEGIENYIILDGQQRLRSILGFLKNEFTINIDGIDYFYKEIKEEVKQINIHIGYYTLKLKDEVEEVELYIDMNENITHSKEDIERAKEYLERLKERAIILEKLKEAGYFYKKGEVKNIKTKSVLIIIDDDTDDLTCDIIEEIKYQITSSIGVEEEEKYHKELKRILGILEVKH
jgi:uncharacterized protein with ParB-like and HNH nuclease domain